MTTGLVHPKYRPDIDGLRAVAVLLVVFFHAFPAVLKGGFIGVDVFFVISGFLISTIIFSNLEQERFSLLDFYGRRVKRIFPALSVTLLSCLVLGWFTLLQEEYQQLGKHIVAGAGFISNLVFWRESGYFDNLADTKPLLHLWSLGIEEQFYIFWPVLLSVAWRLRMKLLHIILAGAALSFFVNALTFRSNPTANFYAPYTRFWELLLGAFLAHLSLYPPSPTRSLKLGASFWNLLSWSGMFLIITGVAVLNAHSLFPGYWALLPVIGSVFIIAAGRNSWLNRKILSRKEMVYIGLISFPLYLWHWPLLSILRIVQGETPSHLMRIGIVLVSFLLAALTYEYIEKPIRVQGRIRFKVQKLAALMLSIGGLGLLCFTNDGWTFRSASRPEVRREGDIGHVAFHRYPYSKFVLCSPMEIQKEALSWEGSVRCFQSKPGQPQIAIVGDSHAEDLFIGLAEGTPTKNIVYYVKNAVPVLSHKDFERIFRSILADKTIETVILAAYWHERKDQITSGSFKEELSATVKELVAKNKNVLLADDVPGFPFDPEKCKFARPFDPRNKCSQRANAFNEKLQGYRPVLEELARLNPKVTLLSTSKYFCEDGICFMERNGKLLYRDRGHLNIDGSIYLGKRLVKDFAQYF